jgi:phosphoglycolate phosphatase-like HAD superfamily hydrolase
MLECHHKDIRIKINIIKKEQFEKYIIDNDKKHIIFDFDETLCTLLIDWTPWRKKLDELFVTSDLTPKNEPDFNYADIVNRYIEKYGKAGRDEIVALNYRIEEDYYSGYELSPIALPLLESAEKFAQLYLWTSNDRRTVVPILRELEIVDKFQKIVTRNDVDYVKPKAAGFALIHDGRSARSRYLLIGDSRSDSGAAIDASIDFINIAEFNDFLD